MAFPNLYYKRTAATAKACYICSKPTVTVLATINTADFFYTCAIHLTDRGFATRAAEPEPEPTKHTPEEIAKVKQEWEAKQRQKKDREQAKKEDGDGKDGAQKEEEGRDTDGKSNADGSREKKPANAPQAEPPIPKPAHERYVLHRNIFALRTADHRRRRQAAQAKSLAPRLPGAPSTLP